ncbi:PPE family protein [Mycobacterium botniense]|uniref:PPE family protein n=1 Tax=Mycobacterium botniense TaxID=84962 RepID=A0A7I9XTJ5_9MYCO|nr:PPE family protein [Mycobacterium botniense]GFG73341.1 PPE family protein [Mycobacterium botniense]
MIAFDFGALPPEVNSGRMYAGAGSGPLMAAAAAWDGVAAELSSAAASYQGVVSELTENRWLGPSSIAMSTAAAPYSSWMSTTATQAEQTANQIRSAAAAYEAAFAATVPPAVIAANRALLAALVATNFLGQNTPAIAATEAQYAEMWAQDAAAMYGYAGASAAATRLTPFTPTPHNTNPAGMPAQAATVSNATAAVSANATPASGLSVPNILSQLSSGSFLSGISSTIDSLETLYNSFTGFALLSPGSEFSATGTLFIIFPMVATAEGPLVAALSASQASAVGSGLTGGLGGTLVGSSAPAAAATGSATLAKVGVSAGFGQASSVGGLSVPPAWGTAAPEIRLASTAVPMSSLNAAPEAAAAGSAATPCGVMPPINGPVGSVVNTPKTSAGTHPRCLRSKVLPPWAVGPNVHGHPAGRPAQPQHRARNTPGSLGERERAELEQLRKELTTLTKKRDLLKRVAVFMIKQAQNKQMLK